MDEKRIKIAEKNFNRYLQEGQIKKVKFEDIIYDTYFRNSSESLSVANDLFDKKQSSLWVVIISYYAMFYMACAYIYKKGYKANYEIVHQIINESLIVLARHDLEKHFLEQYEEEKEKALSASQNLLDTYEYEREKRGTFQYETTEIIKEGKAKTSLDRAKAFISIMRQLINKK